jgi:hypothetical protein
MTIKAGNAFIIWFASLSWPLAAVSLLPIALQADIAASVRNSTH